MNKSIDELKEISLQVRKDVIEMIYKAGSGHPGGSLSATDILTFIYFNLLGDNDRFFLSNGHICPALYSVMAEKGLIERNLLDTYTELGSPLQGHPERTKLDGIENTSGPLGLGLGMAAGFASSLKVDSKEGTIYCMTSDGEHDEGNTWEAATFAAKYKLDNLVQILDKNGVQIEGTTDEIMPLGDIKKRYEAIGWEAFEMDGNNLQDVSDTFEKVKEKNGNPKLIIANTVFGKGVSFMEGNPDWHAKALNEEEFNKAMEELLI